MSLPCVGGLLLLQTALTWTSVEGVSIPVPPPEHPRVYLRARDLPDLRRRTEHPVLKPVWERLQSLGAKSPARAAEADALRYLVNADKDAGRRAAATALKLLQETTFDLKAQDVTRPIGRLMVTGAVVYDWCYPLLSPEEKQSYVERLRDWAGKLEGGFPPARQGAVTGHYSEWILMRDLLSAGLAVYDESPEMYRAAAQRFFGIFVPPRNWWYRGGAFHQGAAYAETRGSSELYPLWIFARLGAGAVYDPALEFLPYEWIYTRRPDGQLLRSGDGQSKPPKLRSLLNASYYKNPYVLADFLRDPEIDAASLLFEFLWRDPDLQPRPVAELPWSRYFGTPYGWMVARSGWDESSVIAQMKVNEFNFNNHQHLDAGAFQIYYRGPLALDSGLYEGDDGGYGSPHDTNYNKRTIAHNSLLIYDPQEVFERSKRPYRNDGGQRFPNGWREPRSLEDMLANYRTGTVLAHDFGPDAKRPLYTWLEGDLTAAYSGKVRRVERAFVYLNFPDSAVKAALAVFDRVTASDAQFKKFWLLHAMEEPRVEGNAITIAPRQRGWQGKLVDRVLLPERADLTPVGGAGKEFWVFGVNFPNKPYRGPAQDFETGEWRVEVTPRDAAASDEFLNVMQVMDRETPAAPVARITAGPLEGFLLNGVSVLFQRGGGRSQGPLSFHSAGSRFLVTGLAAGAWRVSRDGKTAATRQVTPESGALWWEGPSGSYKLALEANGQ